MDFAEVLSLVEDVPGGPYAVLAAVVGGLVGILLLCFAVSGGTKAKKEPREPAASESEGEEVTESNTKQQQTRIKPKQPSKKVTLPSHPLLAAEFKGHTGAVLSLDFDSNGKYLASCSDGEFSIHCSISISINFCQIVLYIALLLGYH